MRKGIIIDIDPASGFCFGVEKAIEKAEETIRSGSRVLGLGHMVHNEEEIDRLDSLGLKTIELSELSRYSKQKVIFRAHGEPPSSYALAKKYQIDVIDATCPIVTSLQKKIRERYVQLDRDEEQIVIFGKKGHPETTGLMGQTNEEAVLITNPDEISSVDKEKKVYLFSQTTMDPDDFKKLEINLQKQLADSDPQSLVSSCSICGQMKKRKPALKEFALKHDLVLFVSGKESSNGKMLYEYCRKQNMSTFWIHNTGDIDTEWFKEKRRIGISGATSTPGWQLLQVKAHLESLLKD